MSKLNRLIILVLSMALCLVGFAACGDNDEPPTPPPAPFAIEITGDGVVKADDGKKTATVTEMGELTLSYSANYTPEQVAFTVSDNDTEKEIATITRDGKLTALYAGTATVTLSAAYGGEKYTDTLTLTVGAYDFSALTASYAVEAVDGIELSLSAPSVKNGETLTVTAEQKDGKYFNGVTLIGYDRDGITPVDKVIPATEFVRDGNEYTCSFVVAACFNSVKVKAIAGELNVATAAAECEYAIAPEDGDKVLSEDIYVSDGYSTFSEAIAFKFGYDGSFTSVENAYGFVNFGVEVFTQSGKNFNFKFMVRSSRLSIHTNNGLTYDDNGTPKQYAATIASREEVADLFANGEMSVFMMRVGNTVSIVFDDGYGNITPLCTDAELTPKDGMDADDDYTITKLVYTVWNTEGTASISEGIVCRDAENANGILGNLSVDINAADGYTVTLDKTDGYTYNDEITFTVSGTNRIVLFNGQQIDEVGGEFTVNARIWNEITVTDKIVFAAEDSELYDVAFDKPEYEIGVDTSATITVTPDSGVALSAITLGGVTYGLDDFTVSSGAYTISVPVPTDRAVATVDVAADYLEREMEPVTMKADYKDNGGSWEKDSSLSETRTLVSTTLGNPYASAGYIRLGYSNANGLLEGGVINTASKEWSYDFSFEPRIYLTNEQGNTICYTLRIARSGSNMYIQIKYYNERNERLDFNNVKVTDNVAFLKALIDGDLFVMYELDENGVIKFYSNMGSNSNIVQLAADTVFNYAGKFAAADYDEATDKVVSYARKIEAKTLDTHAETYVIAGKIARSLDQISYLDVIGDKVMAELTVADGADGKITYASDDITDGAELTMDESYTFSVTPASGYLPVVAINGNRSVGVKDGNTYTYTVTVGLWVEIEVGYRTDSTEFVLVDGELEATLNKTTFTEGESVTVTVTETDEYGLAGIMVDGITYIVGESGFTKDGEVYTFTFVNENMSASEVSVKILEKEWTAQIEAAGIASGTELPVYAYDGLASTNEAVLFRLKWEDANALNADGTLNKDSELYKQKTFRFDISYYVGGTRYAVNNCKNDGENTFNARFTSAYVNSGTNSSATSHTADVTDDLAFLTRLVNGEHYIAIIRTGNQYAVYATKESSTLALIYTVTIGDSNDNKHFEKLAIRTHTFKPGKLASTATVLLRNNDGTAYTLDDLTNAITVPVTVENKAGLAVEGTVPATATYGDVISGLKVTAADGSHGVVVKCNGVAIPGTVSGGVYSFADITVSTKADIVIESVTLEKSFKAIDEAPNNTDAPKDSEAAYLSDGLCSDSEVAVLYLGFGRNLYDAATGKILSKTDLGIDKTWFNFGPYIKLAKNGGAVDTFRGQINMVPGANPIVKSSKNNFAAAQIEKTFDAKGVAEKLFEGEYLIVLVREGAKLSFYADNGYGELTLIGDSGTDYTALGNIQAIGISTWLTGSNAAHIASIKSGKIVRGTADYASVVAGYAYKASIDKKATNGDGLTVTGIDTATDYRNGEQKTFTVAVGEAFAATVMLNGKEVTEASVATNGGIKTYTYTVTLGLFADFEIATRDLRTKYNFANGTGYTVEIVDHKAGGYLDGETLTFRVAPASGYAIVSVAIGNSGALTGTDGTYAYTVNGNDGTELKVVAVTRELALSTASIATDATADVAVYTYDGLDLGSEMAVVELGYDLSHTDGYVAGYRQEILNYNGEDGSKDADAWNGNNIIINVGHANGQKYAIQFNMQANGSSWYSSASSNLGINVPMWSNATDADGFSFETILARLTAGTYKLIVMRDSENVTILVDNGCGGVAQIFKNSVRASNGATIAGSPITGIYLAKSSSNYKDVRITGGKIVRGSTDYATMLDDYAYKATVVKNGNDGDGLTVTGIDTATDYRYGEQKTFTVAVGEAFAATVMLNGNEVVAASSAVNGGVRTYTYTATLGLFADFEIATRDLRTKYNFANGTGYTVEIVDHKAGGYLDGETLTFRVAPASGYVIASVAIGNSGALTGTDGTYAYTVNGNDGTELKVTAVTLEKAITPQTIATNATANKAVYTSDGLVTDSEVVVLQLKYDLDNSNGYKAGLDKEMTDYNKCTVKGEAGEGSVDVDPWNGLNFIMKFYHTDGTAYEIQMIQFTPTVAKFYSSKNNLNFGKEFYNNGNKNGATLEGILKQLDEGTWTVIFVRDKAAGNLTMYADNGYGEILKLGTSTFTYSNGTVTTKSVSATNFSKIEIMYGCSNQTDMTVNGGVVVRGTNDYLSVLDGYKATISKTGVAESTSGLVIDGINTTDNYSYGTQKTFEVETNEAFKTQVLLNGKEVVATSTVTDGGVTTSTYTVTLGLYADFEVNVYDIRTKFAFADTADYTFDTTGVKADGYLDGETLTFKVAPSQSKFIKSVKVGSADAIVTLDADYVATVTYTVNGADGNAITVTTVDRTLQLASTFIASSNNANKHSEPDFINADDIAVSDEIFFGKLKHTGTAGFSDGDVGTQAWPYAAFFIYSKKADGSEDMTPYFQLLMNKTAKTVSVKASAAAWVTANERALTADELAMLEADGYPFAMVRSGETVSLYCYSVADGAFVKLHENTFSGIKYFSGACVSSYKVIGATYLEGTLVRGTSDIATVTAAKNKVTIVNNAPAAASAVVAGINESGYAHSETIEFTVTTAAGYVPSVTHNGEQLAYSSVSENVYTFKQAAEFTNAIVVSAYQPTTVETTSYTAYTGGKTVATTTEPESYDTEMFLAKIKYNDTSNKLLTADKSAFATDHEKMYFDIRVSTNSTAETNTTNQNNMCFRIYTDSVGSANFKFSRTYQLNKLADATTLYDIDSIDSDLLYAQNLLNGNVYIGFVRTGKTYTFFTNAAGNNLRPIFSVVAPSDDADNTWVNSIVIQKGDGSGTLDATVLGYERAVGYSYTLDDLNRLKANA